MGARLRLVIVGVLASTIAAKKADGCSATATYPDGTRRFRRFRFETCRTCVSGASVRFLLLQRPRPSTEPRLSGALLFLLLQRHHQDTFFL